jgi:spore coat protein CotF
MTNLSQKERTLLQDQKSHEELCIKKYGSYANQAQDSQLKQIFNNNRQQEEQHLNTINQLLGGQMPNMSSQQMQPQSQSQPQTGMNSQSDADLCTDILMTEKYVSSAYNTAIFEFSDPNIRQTLNHLQKEEQEHGEAVFKYMESKGMYSTQ